MLQKRHNSIITFFILLTLIGASKPAKVLAQSDVVEEVNQNLNLDDSGVVNPEFENSGLANPVIEGSGKVEFNTQGSGDVNSEFEDSGFINLNVDSGEANTEIEDSGKPIYPIEVNQIESVESVAQLAEPEADVIVEEEDNSGLWWILLLLLPLAALALYLFSRGKKSDQEPAIGTMPDHDNPSGGLGVPSTNRDNLYARSNSRDLNSVAGNGTFGGTALAEGVTSNLVNERVDGDRFELETKPEPVVEIPSNPVSEFTPTEARLQTTEQPTIQTDNGDDDTVLNLPPAEETTPNPFVEEQIFTEARLQTTEQPIIQTDNGDDDTALNLPLAKETTPNPLVEEQIFVEEAKDLPENDSTLAIPSDDLEQPRATEENPFEQTPQPEAKEFRGDYVLEEETEEFDLEQLDTAVDSDWDRSLDANSDESSLDSELTDFTDDTTTAEVGFYDDKNTIIADNENTIVEDPNLSQTPLDDTAILGGEAVASAYLVRDRLEPTEVEESDNRDPLIDDDNSTEAIADEDFETTNNVDTTLEEITFDDVENADAGLNEISLETENAADINLDNLAFDESDQQSEISLSEITFDDVENADAGSNEISLDDLTFDDVENAEASLDEISLEIDNLINVSLNNIDTASVDQNIRLDDSTYDPLSDRTAEITDLDDESNDIDNISEWLDSLESDQNTDNITEWLEQLKVDDDYVSEENNHEEINTNNQTDDVSFKFLENLLEEDSDPTSPK